ncbi:unnamed protein product [Ceratitis capitata]|uniref:(Mediterranean fruit fly) hypothetical protein n=1 Tax=Ceratitis capitata TaxID=7213 RepID=A0A811V1W1_CERCA|nr:unnamed protein product [Ceratitis capitata]
MRKMNSRDEPEKTFKVAMPDNAYATVYLRDAMSVEEFLASACARRNLNPMEHFVRVKKRRDMEDHNYFVPHRNDLIENYLHNHEFVEVCMKILYQVELHRTTLEQMWGFSVEAELIENAERQDELCCYVSRVEDKSVAMQNGNNTHRYKQADHTTRISDSLSGTEKVIPILLCRDVAVIRSFISLLSHAVAISLSFNTNSYSLLPLPSCKQ